MQTDKMHQLKEIAFTLQESTFSCDRYGSTYKLNAKKLSRQDAETATVNGIEPYEHLILVLSMLSCLGKSPAYKNSKS